ncbi:hypothetical protein EVA_08796 [gut metagenome]|uniref:Uncharacterized protein n=1 Tax=gut metagenome TaxID=749906 RepID=J9GSC5_9ZZZZ
MPDDIKIEMASPKPIVVQGSTGLATQLPGACITVDAIGGGIGDGLNNLAQIAADSK